MQPEVHLSLLRASSGVFLLHGALIAVGDEEGGGVMCQVIQR